MRIWTEHRAATIASMIGFVAIVGVGGWLLLRSPSNASQPTTTTSTTSASHPAPQTTDWPTYGLDAARTRYLPSDRVQPPYKLAWSYDAGHLMEYSPIVVGDTLYGIDNNGEAFALDTRNGKPRWRRDVATLNASAPTYDSGRLYVSNLEPGQVQALNAESGKVVWRHPLPGRTRVQPAGRGQRGDRRLRVRLGLRTRRPNRQGALEYRRGRRGQGVTGL